MPAISAINPIFKPAAIPSHRLLLGGGPGNYGARSFDAGTRGGRLFLQQFAEGFDLARFFHCLLPVMHPVVAPSREGWHQKAHSSCGARAPIYRQCPLAASRRPGISKSPTEAALSSATTTARRWLTCISRPSPEGGRRPGCSRATRRGA
jgi:hypothetical protein